MPYSVNVLDKIICGKCSNDTRQNKEFVIANTVTTNKGVLIAGVNKFRFLYLPF